MTDPTPRPVAPHPPLEVYDRDEAARRGYVDRLFDTSARHYWWINNVMSLGSGIWYRRKALERAGIGAGMSVLDVCMGSGQVSRAALQQVGAHGRVIGLDASLGMLVAARSHVRLPQVQAYVERLPIADGSFDALTMGYALRHVADLVGTFREYRRVLRPNGRVLIIEFAKPTRPLAARVLELYLKHIVPGIARIAGRDASRMMRYFWDTIDACVPPATIVDSLKRAGFDEPRRGGEFELFAEYTATRPS